MKEDRLLIIDDDTQICELLKDIGESCGYIVSSVLNPVEFPNIYHDFNPTVMILDLSLSGKDGVELLRFLAENQCKCPIIILSGCDERIRSSAVRLGQSYGLKIPTHLPKPIDLSTLKKILAEFKVHTKETTPERLEKAIKNNELVLYYQPKILSKTDELSGVEILIRWQPPDGPMIYPDDFIPLAEKTNLIKELTYWVIDNAFKQKRAWIDSNLPLGIAVNLSPYLLNDLLLPDKIDELIKKHEIPIDNICFEITETGMLNKPEIAMDILTRLGIKGFKLSIDDFGTGYSSLVELHKMPFSELKIDKSFVMNLLKDEDAWIITRSIVDLGHNLGLTVVAEGVENEKIVEKLRNINCDMLQGYYFSKPIPIVEFNQWLKDKLDDQLRFKYGTKPL